MRKKRVNSDRPLTALQLERETLLRLCDSFPTPRSLAVKLLISANDYAGYLSLDWDPRHYASVDQDRLRSDYLVSKFLAKSQNLPLEVDRRQVALEKFKAAEMQCHLTNEGLMSAISSSDEAVKSILRSARSFIAAVLGPVSATTWESISRGCGFGPGATLSVRGLDVSMDAKYGNPEITSTLATANFFLFSDNGLRGRLSGSQMTIVPGGKLSFVPKDAKTDRSIVTEADLNIFFQRGIGQYIKSRLLSFGCNLYDQGGNQSLAKRAFTDGLATIDLASASDTVSIRTVEYLLPRPWLRLLATFRSPSVQLPDGSWVELEKWSSMGNGYTFELETLIFWAVARATSLMDGQSELDVGTYGDDIIVPQRVYRQVIQVLELLGFSTNEAKSFGEGCFFESCGCDYFAGCDVRPIFARREKYGKRHTREEHSFYIYQIANGIRSWSAVHIGGGICDSRARNVYDWLLSQLPADHRYHVPVGYDGGIHSELDEAHDVAFGRKRRTWNFRELTKVPRRRSGRDAPLLSATLNGQYSASDDKSRMIYGHIEETRGEAGWVSKNRTVPYWGWTGPGPWL